MCRRGRILRGISSNWTDVDHSITELDESAPTDGQHLVKNSAGSASPFNRNIQVRDIMQDKFHQDFVTIFADMLDKRLRWELFSEFVRREPVLRERVVEFIDDYKKEAN